MEAASANTFLMPLASICAILSAISFLIWRYDNRTVPISQTKKRPFIADKDDKCVNRQPAVAFCFNVCQSQKYLPPQFYCAGFVFIFSPRILFGGYFLVIPAEPVLLALRNSVKDGCRGFIFSPAILLRGF